MQEEAIQAIDAYVAATRKVEFSYDNNINPLGLSPADLSASVEQAHRQMMAALAPLGDQQIASILDAHPDRDHDGSGFPVTTLAEVRAWQRQHRGADIDEEMKAE